MSARRFADQDWSTSTVFVALRAGGLALVDPQALAAIPNTPDLWVVIAPEDALAAPGFERMVTLTAINRPDVQIFYGDDVALGETGAERLRLKPAFNLSLLIADDYVGAPLAVRAAALHRLGLRTELGDAALYDLVLRAAAQGFAVERLPYVLMAQPGRRVHAPLAERRRAVLDWIGGGAFEVADGLTPQTLQLKRRFDTFPDATLVVPTRQSGPAGRPFVVELLDSLTGLDWPMDRLTVLVGDDTDRTESFPPGRWPFAVRRIHTPRPPGEAFSYAAKMNRLWRAAETEQIVLLNDDVTVTSPGWLRALLTFSMEADVGGCGGRLLYPDGRVQHAGMAGGLFGGVTHLWINQAGDAPTYQDWAVQHREWSMVTGAVFATRRSVLEAAAGFDERFSLEFNDVDLCLRLRLMGYRIVYTPFAEAIHRERASRADQVVAGDQTALFLSRWRSILADDPAYHPKLTRTLGNATPAGEPDWYDRLK